MHGSCCMVERMARTGWTDSLKRALLAVAVAAGVPIAAAAQLQPPAATAPAAGETKPEGEMPPLSRDCQIGANQIVSQTPLPNVERALRERHKIVILAMGSSPLRRESGSGGYLDLVERVLEEIFKVDVKIVHRGVPGELARDASERIKMEVALVNPDLVLWQVGTADALARLPVETFEETLTESLIWLRGHGVDVALVGLHYIKALAKDEHYQAIRAVLKRVSAAHSIMRISRYEAAEILTRLRSEQGRPLTGTRLAETAYECSSEYLARAIASGLFAKTKGAQPPLLKK